MAATKSLTTSLWRFRKRSRIVREERHHRAQGGQNVPAVHGASCQQLRVASIPKVTVLINIEPAARLPRPRSANPCARESDTTLSGGALPDRIPCTIGRWDFLLHVRNTQPLPARVDRATRPRVLRRRCFTRAPSNRQLRRCRHSDGSSRPPFDDPNTRRRKSRQSTVLAGPYLD